MITDRLDIDAGAFEAATGWQIKPEGACKGEVCVPLDQSARAGGGFDLVATADRLGMAIVADADAGLWSIGPESFGGRSLATAEAPELSLPDVLRAKTSSCHRSAERRWCSPVGRPIEAAASTCPGGRHCAMKYTPKASRSSLLASRWVAPMCSARSLKWPGLSIRRCLTLRTRWTRSSALPTSRKFCGSMRMG